MPDIQIEKSDNDKTTIADIYLHYMFFNKKYDEAEQRRINEMVKHFRENYTFEEAMKIIDGMLEEHYGKEFVKKAHDFVDKIIKEV